MDPLEGRRTPAVFTVTTPLDNGAGPAVSLREAVRMANQAPGPDTINFAANLAGKKINLTQGVLRISDDLTINGPTAQPITIDANDRSQIFRVERGSGSNGAITVRMSHLRLIDGSTVAGGGAIDNREDLTLESVVLASNLTKGEDFTGGGAIFNDGGTLTLQGCVLRQNRSAIGGGALSNNRGQVTINDTSITKNSGQRGGAIRSNGGNVTLNRVDLSNNESRFTGGGVDLLQGTLSVNGSTFSHNRASTGAAIRASGSTISILGATLSNNVGKSGMAIETQDGTVTLTNTTVANNVATISVDGALAVDGGSLTLRNVTVAGTSGSAAIAIKRGATLTLNDTIVAEGRGRSGPDVTNTGGTLILQDRNVVQDGSVTGPGVITGDPLLGPLGNNGGPTQTFLPRAGSPVIDAGDLESALSTLFDQRGAGFDRIVGKGIDLGAVEVQEQE